MQFFHIKSSVDPPQVFFFFLGIKKISEKFLLELLPEFLKVSLIKMIEKISEGIYVELPGGVLGGTLGRISEVIFTGFKK